jgi:hypothetical protein
MVVALYLCSIQEEFYAKYSLNLSIEITSITDQA